MKTQLSIFLLIFSCLGIFSQQIQTDSNSKTVSIVSKLPNNSISIDESFSFSRTIALKNLISINYERLLFRNRSNSLNYFIKVGVGKVQANDLYENYNPDLQLPVSMVILYGKSCNLFELNIGMRLLDDKANEKKYSLFGILDFGYRYQAPRSDVYFKALAGTDGITIGIGYAF